MALNLSTLTNSATSASILNEALTTADLLDPVPILKNLSRGSNKGGDAKQTTGLNQPRALPLIKNPSGNLGGYLYIPNVSGNYATGPSVTIGSNETWEAEVDVVITQFGNYFMPMGGGDWTAGFGLLMYAGENIRMFSKGSVSPSNPSGVTLGTPVNIKYGFGAIGLYVKINDVIVSQSSAAQASSITHTLELNHQAALPNQGNYAIQKAKLTVNSAVVFDCDFNGSTSIRHGDTKFNCVGGPVSLTRAGQDPITVVKKGVLRFDGSDDGLQGLFGQTITEGYLFASFSVLGSGGDNYARLFIINPTGGTDAGHFLGFRLDASNTFRSDTGGSGLNYSNMYDDERGDVLYEYKFKSGDTRMRFNNATGLTSSGIVSCSAQEFSIAASEIIGDNNASLDLEYLALFPATITDAEANRVRDFINTRNNVFDLKDGFGYYFYDAQKAPVGAITTGSASWNGRIVGSDFGDSDRYATQGTTNDAPVGDGFVVTFADNTDHLDIPQVTQAGWQVVGTSLGTFAYRVNNNAVTELNLLGNLGSASYRQAGQSYGIILLPESATGADIEAARKLLIDRGSLDGSLVSAYFANWVSRNDIVEFHSVDLSNATNVSSAWDNCSSLTTFPALNLSGATNISYSWFLCSSLNNFGAIDARNGTNFTGAWKSCSALTSFPSGAKLGTAAANVDFSFAWNSSGLTAFNTPLPTANSVYYAWQNCTSLTSFSSELPLVTDVRLAWHTCSSLSEFRTTDIKNGTNFTSAWQNCSALTSFPQDAKLGTSASNVNFTDAWRSSGLTSFSTPLPTATSLTSAFRYCSSLSSFNLDELPLVTHINTAFQSNAISSFNTKLPKVNYAYAAWYACTALTDFSADVFTNWNPSSISTGVFDGTWSLCTSLTAQSVENILTSIDASGKYATTTGASGGSALADAGIDITYNVATGSLSAATNTAIDSLSGKGWEVYINGVLVIPNILDLAPAAAYSLRSFDANADPNVVNVRRSSDNATSDFKASEVSDGTLTTWVGEQNLITYSNSFVGNWSLTGSSTLTAGQAGYDGTNDATEFYDSRSNTSYGLYKVISSPINGQINASIYLKAGTVSTGQLDLFYTGGGIRAVSFDLSNGTVEAGILGGSSQVADAVGITNVGNGWYRVNLTQDYGSPLLQYVRIGLSSAGTIFIQDAQVVEGASVRTYAETNASQSGDGHVTTWYDQGGTNHASQPLVSNMPKIVDGGTLVTEGGLAALDFDGTDDHLNFASSITTKALFCVTSSVQSINDELILSNGAGGGTGKHFGFNDGVYLREYPEYSPGYTHGLSSNEQSLVSATILSGNKDYYVNSSTVGASSGTALPSYNMIGIPSGLQNFEGNAQEIVIYDSDQSANRTGIENNINDHFTIYS